MFAEVTGDVIAHRRRQTRTLFSGIMQCRVAVDVRDVNVTAVKVDQPIDAETAPGRN